MGEMPLFFCTTRFSNHDGGLPLARNQFSFKKRQKELARKKKQEEKRQRKLAKKEARLGNESADGENDDTQEAEPEDNQFPDGGPEDPA